jgi:hypothetical protein
MSIRYLNTVKNKSLLCFTQKNFGHFKTCLCYTLTYYSPTTLRIRHILLITTNNRKNPYTKYKTNWLNCGDRSTKATKTKQDTSKFPCGSTDFLPNICTGFVLFLHRSLPCEASVIAVMNLQVPYNKRTFFTSWATITILRMIQLPGVSNV